MLGDATGHGIAPALSVTQMHAMLRMAPRLGADLETAFAQLNDQLADTLPDGRFITAFIGLLDPVNHRLHYVCAGQGPVLHRRAADGQFESLPPTSFPLGAMRLPGPRPASTLELQPGDLLLLVSDGATNSRVKAARCSARPASARLVTAHACSSMAGLAATLLAEVKDFAETRHSRTTSRCVLLKRDAASR